MLQLQQEARGSCFWAPALCLAALLLAALWLSGGVEYPFMEFVRRVVFRRALVHFTLLHLAVAAAPAMSAA